MVRTTKKGRREMRGKPGGICSSRKMDKVKSCLPTDDDDDDDDPYLPESLNR